MGGGTLQLVVFGGQDIHLMGNPEFSYFKSVYRKHTNFSMECIEQTRIGNINIDDFTLNYEISKSGDLLNKMHFEIDLPKQTMVNINGGDNYCSYTNNTAYSYMKNVELYIGEKLIDKHDGKWYDIMNELNHDNNDGLDYLVNKHRAGVTDKTSPADTKLYIPLQFWFTKGDVSLSLPLIALQYDNVKIKVNFRGLKKIINSKKSGNEDDTTDELVTGQDSANPKKPNIKLWATYILLDEEERKRFAQSSHEYLIEQVQTFVKDYSPVIDINLNHPIKCLYWVIQNNVANTEKSNYFLIDSSENTYGDDNLTEENNRFKHGNDYLNFKTHEIVNPSYLKSFEQYEHFKEMTIKFNGIERFEKRDATYFRTIQPLEVGYTFPEKNIYMYSFCLKPEENQPSGSCNFSRIDNLTFNFTGNQLYSGYTFNLYAKNYNILRIIGGMGGLLYSN